MFDKYIAYIVLTKSILDKSLENSKVYDSFEKKMGTSTMKLYRELGSIFDYAMIYRDYKNKDLLEFTSGLYFKYDDLKSEERADLEKQLPGFNELFQNLKNN